MAGLIARFGKLRVTADLREPYAALCETVVYQQLHGKAAATIFGRVVAQLGHGGRFPLPQRLLDAPDEALRAVGLSHNKAAALRDIARHAADGRLPDLAACQALGDEELIARLVDIRGIGRWTAEMYLMSSLGRPDILPVGDLGVRKGYQTAYNTEELPAPKALAKAGEAWSPCRTLATLYLWRAAGTNG